MFAPDLIMNIMLKKKDALKCVFQNVLHHSFNMELTFLENPYYWSADNEDINCIDHDYI